jgi:Flp pilus assembly protein TadB
MTVAAFVWSFGLVPAALLVPVANQTKSGVNGLSLTKATLVQADGVKVLIPVALPAVLTLLVAIAMRRRYRTGRDWSTPAAWVLVGLLALLVVVSNVLLGAFVVPAVILLGAALATLPTALPSES